MADQNQKRFIMLLSAAALLLICADIAGKISTQYFGHNYVGGLVPLFDLNVEGNVPTWFSSMLLLTAAALLWRIGADTASRRGPFVRHWKVLACIFVYVSMDEASAIHEHLSPCLRGHWHTSGLFFFAWVIPAMIILFGLWAGYAGFLRHLPARTRSLFLSAGLVYIGAAGCLECVEGLIVTTVGRSNMFYAPILTLEEAGEMAGAIIFIYALMSYRAKKA